MTTGRAGNTSQVAALVTYAAAAAPRASGLAAMMVLGAAARFAAADAVAALVPYAAAADARAPNASAVAALVPYADHYSALARASAVAELVVWGVAPPGAEARTRAWTFTLDGHPFYVLDLGEEGTFLYDISTSSWCRFSTDGYTGWNMRVGATWGEANRVVGGDTFNGIAWELDPDVTIDEGFRDIFHAATGGMMTRSRTFLGVESVRVIGSLGDLDSDAPIAFALRFSDDNGATWSQYFNVEMAAGDFSGEVAWRSLGSFAAPGRVFEFTDYGGLQRIDGADAFIEDFDDVSTKYLRQYGVFE